jgi:AraC family transcriptional activator of pobA
MEAQVVSTAAEFNTSDLKLKGFKAYKIETNVHPIPNYSRRDFYKVCVIEGNSHIQYADREIVVDGPYLFFGNPHVPYSSTLVTGGLVGYSCLFTEEFLKANDRSDSFNESPLFKVGGTPVFEITKEQKVFVDTLFQKILAEQSENYFFKNDLIRNYINLIIHEALKMQPPDTFFKHKNASSRITHFFFELLERQFPIESVHQPLKLKTAQDYAQNLAVHVNHLNRAVKEVTGKPTSTHIAERIVTEAKALLQHTDWSVADVAYALGFEYPTYFNNFFKRVTGTVPKSFRP